MLSFPFKNKTKLKLSNKLELLTIPRYVINKASLYHFTGFLHSALHSLITASFTHPMTSVTKTRPAVYLKGILEFIAEWGLYESSNSQLREKKWVNTFLSQVTGSSRADI